MVTNIRYSIRSLLRTPAFAAAAVATLALGIGANTAIFSLLEAVILRTLPVRDPGELYFVGQIRGGDVTMQSNFPWFERVQQRIDVFAGVTAYNIRNFKVAWPEGMEQVVGQYVGGNYHALLGAPMALGRGFSVERDRAAGSSPYAVISDRYWARRFDRRPDAIGQTLVVGGRAVTIVGVTAAEFEGLSPGRAVDVTLPLSIRIQDDPDFLEWTDAWTNMPLVARLRAGVSHTTAEAALEATYRQYMARPGRQFGQGRTAILLPASRGADRLREDYGRALEVLMAMVGLVLLVACMNVANLLLVRGSSREREIAIRVSIGASRRRIVSQLLTESCVLAVAGGAVGVLLASWGTRLITTTLASGQDPVILDAQPNLTVLSFAAVLSILTGILFGLAPAVTASRVALGAFIKDGVTASPRRQPARQALVAIQLALSVVLLFGAVLLTRTLQNLGSVEAGITADSLVLVGLDAFDTPLPDGQLSTICADVVERLRSRPGVEHAACSTMSPADEGFAMMTVAVPTPPNPSDSDVYVNWTTPGYFSTYDIPLVMGRGLSETDTASTPLVAVVNQAFVRFYLPRQNPVGETIRFGRASGRPITIVGVVRDTRQDLRSPAPRMVYQPLSQGPSVRQLTVAIRSTEGPGSLASAVRDDIRSRSSDVAVTFTRTMREQMRAALVSERLLATLSSAFGGLALLLATIGLYGVISFDVARRRREIGVRLALGADPAAVLGAVIGQAACVTLAGLAAGIGAAFFASQAVSRFLFGIEPRDPATLALTALALGATAMVTGYFPARRASRLDPAQILRAE